MKILRTIVISLFIVILASSAACSFGQSAAAQPQTTIAKGDITVKVNGTGKTGYANDIKLAFGTAGKIEKLAVKKGDSVTKGTVMAKLDTGSLELALSQAQVAEAQAKVAYSTAQVAQTQAEAALSAAQFELDRTTVVSEIKDQITNLDWTIKAAQVNMTQALATGNTSSANSMNQYIADNQRALEKQQQKLQELLAKSQYSGVATYEIGGQRYDRLIVEDVHMKAQQVQIAQQSIDQAKLSVLQSKLTVDQASKAVSLAQKQLIDATIIAPFDGAVASLDIKLGDIVAAPGLSTGTPIYMVDTKSLEINTEIDEIDVANITVGQKALINFDALPNMKFDGIVTAISLIPIVKPQNSGVVVYEVKVGFAGTPPAQAKSGMSANVDIVTTEKKDVVLAPNKSIKRNSQGQNVVSVIVNQKVEERVVALGLSDGTQTEIINGLQAGDIIIKLAVSNNSKSS